MAAVTITNGPGANINGSFREYYYYVDIANDGDYLDVPLKVVKNISLCDDTLTAVGVASVALNSNGLSSRLTFNTGGAINDCYVKVAGL
jgi:hypothetical protein